MRTSRWYPRVPRLDRGPVVLTALTLLAGIVVLAPGSAASASPAETPHGSAVVFGAAEYGDDIATQYAASRRDANRGLSRKHSFATRVAREYGSYYDAAYLDFLHLERTGNAKYPWVEVVAPRNYKVTQVQLSETIGNTDESGRTFDTQFAAADGFALDDTVLSYPDGPGFSISWDISHSGQYLLTTSRGDLLATWARGKLLNESDSTYDYWVYQRKGAASPSGTGVGLDTFGIKSYPYSTTPLHHWVDWAPSIGTYNGACSTPVSLSVTALGIGASLSYTPCDHYVVSQNSSSPGDFSVNWSRNGGIIHGDHEVAFEWTAASGQGKSLVVHDYQYVNFVVYGPQSIIVDRAGCGSTDASKTC